MDNDALKDRIFRIEKIETILSNRHYYTFHTLDYIIKNNKGFLALGTFEEIEEDLNMMSNNFNIISKGNNKEDYIIEKRMINGIAHYRYSPTNYKKQKIFSKVLWGLKSKKEQRKIKSQRREEFTKIYWLPILILTYIAGLFTNPISEYIIDKFSNKNVSKYQDHSQSKKSENVTLHQKEVLKSQKIKKSDNLNTK